MQGCANLVIWHQNLWAQSHWQSKGWCSSNLTGPLIPNECSTYDQWDCDSETISQPVRVGSSLVLSEYHPLGVALVTGLAGFVQNKQVNQNATVTSHNSSRALSAPITACSRLSYCCFCSFHYSIQLLLPTSDTAASHITNLFVGIIVKLGVSGGGGNAKSLLYIYK